MLCLITGPDLGEMVTNQNQWPLKEQASKGIQGYALSGIILDFNSLKSPSLGFRVIQKNLIIFLATVETGINLYLYDIITTSVI